MASAALHDRTAPDIFGDQASVTINEGEMDAHVRHAVARMVAWCERQPRGAEFLARGFVIDTMGDITRQITDYFPAHIDTTPIIDDMAFVVAQNAKSSGQRYQELELSYIGDGKIPQDAQANLQSFVKWYSAENVIGGDFGGHHKHLKPGWSGGAGGDGASLLKQLNLGTKKGFLLQVRALDIKDAKAQGLLAHVDIVQAFGGSPAAVAQAAEAIAKGGAEGQAMQAVVDQMVEIKTLRTALTNAADTPAAAPIAAALAHKTESVAATMATLNAPAPVKADIARAVDTVKIDLGARQIAGVVAALSIALPSAIVGRAANINAAPQAPANVKTTATASVTPPTGAAPVQATPAQAAPIQVAPVQAVPVQATPMQATGTQAPATRAAQVQTPQAAAPAAASSVSNAPVAAVPVTTTPQIARAVEAVQHMARTQGMPVRDVIATVLAGKAAPEMAAPVKTLAAVMASPDFLPTLARSVPAAVAAPVHAALTTPVLQAVAQTPVSIAQVAQSVQAVAQATPLPTVQMAATMLRTMASPATPEAITLALRAPAMQAVAENLNALSMTQAVPEAAKPALMVATAQVQTLAVQARNMNDAAPALAPVLHPVQPAAAMAAPVAPMPVAQGTPAPSAPVQTASVPAAPQQTQPLPPQAPMATLAEAVGVTPPAAVPPAPVPPVAATPAQAQTPQQQTVQPGANHPQGPAGDAPRGSPFATPVAHNNNQAPAAAGGGNGGGATARSPVADATARVIPVQPAKPAETGAQAKKPETQNEPGCNGKTCKTCFNKTCVALEGNLVAAMQDTMKNSTGRLTAIAARSSGALKKPLVIN